MLLLLVCAYLYFPLIILQNSFDRTVFVDSSVSLFIWTNNPNCSALTLEQFYKCTGSIFPKSLITLRSFQQNQTKLSWPVHRTREAMRPEHEFYCTEIWCNQLYWITEETLKFLANFLKILKNLIVTASAVSTNALHYFRKFFLVM